MLEHHYTDDMVKTAAAAANGGTCLEDGNTYKSNTFDRLGDAVNQVSAHEIIVFSPLSRV